MPPENQSDEKRRDALLSELDAYHDKLIRAAQARDEERLTLLVEAREDVIERLKRVSANAPIPPEAGQRIAERERELQRTLDLELSGLKTDMAKKARQGNAALRYRRSN